MWKLTMFLNAIDKSRCGITFGCHRCTGKIKDCRLLFKPPKSAVRLFQNEELQFVFVWE